jgi:Putative prokaryotic signal transducing protein
MKRVFTGNTLTDAAHLKNLLEQAGIASFIKNQYLSSGVGELPVFESAPELWVYSEEDAPRAAAVIRDALRPDVSGAADSWRCSACGESNEGQFGACWRCGATDQRS